MKIVFLIMAAITGIAAFMNPYHLIFTAMFAAGYLFIKVNDFMEDEKAHYRRAYWRRYEKNKIKK